MTKSKKDQIDVNGDGRVVLYKRPLTEKYHMRISVPNAKGYYRGTTGHKNTTQASVVAVKKFEELSVKVLSGGHIASKTFGSIFQQYEKRFPELAKVRGKSERYIVDHLRYIKNYPLRYFKNHRVEELNQSNFAEYLVWRNKNSLRRNPFRESLKPYTPTNSTLRTELSAVNMMFQFALENGLISKIPQIKKPPVPKDNRRPTFTLDEYRVLVSKMRSWVKLATTPRSKRSRFYLHHYVLILANCGARVGEIRTLKWKDLRSITTDNQKKKKSSQYLVAKVSGKTGTREVIFQKTSNKYVERIYDYRSKELGHPPDKNEYVISHENGTAIGSFQKSFESLLRYSDLKYDLKGDGRTLYSLRHFYATMRLQEQVSPYLLANRMGTSIEMLQKFYGQPITDEIAEQVAKTQFDDKPSVEPSKDYFWKTN